MSRGLLRAILYDKDVFRRDVFKIDRYFQRDLRQERIPCGRGLQQDGREEEYVKEQETEKEGLLIAAAKALGSTAGKIASLTKTDSAAPPPSAPNEGARMAGGKFIKQKKSRLPRKLKKQNKKAAAKARL